MSVIGLINMSRQDFSSDVGVGSSLDVVDKIILNIDFQYIKRIAKCSC